MSLMERMFSRIQKKPVREKIRYALYRLRVQNDKLEDTMLRLQQKDKDMFQRCVAAQLSRDNPRAEIYAGECAEIRKMARIVLGSKIALERAVLRLETVEQFGDVLMQISPVIGVVKETSGKIEGVIPEIANELHLVNEVLDEVVMASGEIEETNTVISPPNDEARKVLEESSACAEEQIRRQFPEIPIFEKPSELLEMEGIGNTIPKDYATEIVLQQEPLTDSPLDPSLLLSYIERQVTDNGVLNLTNCAQHFGVKREEVLRAVETLAADGRIVARQTSKSCCS